MRHPGGILPLHAAQQFRINGHRCIRHPDRAGRADLARTLASAQHRGPRGRRGRFHAGTRLPGPGGRGLRAADRQCGAVPWPVCAPLGRGHTVVHLRWLCRVGARAVRAWPARPCVPHLRGGVVGDWRPLPDAVAAGGPGRPDGGELSAGAYRRGGPEHRTDLRRLVPAARDWTVRGIAVGHGAPGVFHRLAAGHADPDGTQPDHGDAALAAPDAADSERLARCASRTARARASATGTAACQ